MEIHLAPESIETFGLRVSRVFHAPKFSNFGSAFRDFFLKTYCTQEILLPLLPLDDYFRYFLN